MAFLAKSVLLVRPRGLGTHIKPQLFLHIAPDGDHWTGPPTFAAKHLPSDFIVSVPIETEDDALGLTDEELRAMYDSKCMPTRSTSAKTGPPHDASHDHEKP